MHVIKVDMRKTNAQELFISSLADTGFAVISNHSLPGTLIADTYAEWERFFASDAKHQHLFSPERQSGFFPLKSENAKGRDIKDLKEFYHYFQNRGDVLPTSLSGATKQIFDALSLLASELLAIIAKNSPAEVRRGYSEDLAGMITSAPSSLLRILHYPPLLGAQNDVAAGAVRAAEHGDINLITLLPAASSPGLEVKGVNGNWHVVESDPGSIVVNIADMLEMASGGFFPSTLHRVVNPQGKDANKARYSMPFFAHPRPEVRLSPMHTAQSFLDERLREIGLLKADEKLR